jgi:hypothetical protein
MRQVQGIVIVDVPCHGTAEGSRSGGIGRKKEAKGVEVNTWIDSRGQVGMRRGLKVKRASGVDLRVGEWIERQRRCWWMVNGMRVDESGVCGKGKPVN